MREKEEKANVGKGENPFEKRFSPFSHTPIPFPKTFVGSRNKHIGKNDYHPKSIRRRS